MQNKRIIIVSNRLPIRIERGDNGLNYIPSEGGLATGLKSIHEQSNMLWIGWPGIIPESEKEKQEIIEELKSRNLIPVFLTKEEINNYYEGFSNEILWPIFHYRPSYANFKTEYWECYKEVNTKFCDIILEQYISSKDEIWVHDYQLMLLPQYLRDSFTDLSIGYFQHIPFPNDEVFRTIPWRNELLEGLLGADLIAFHTFNDTQHFLNSCSHILGQPIQSNSVQHKGRTIFSEVLPMGIDFEKYDSLSKSKEVQELSSKIKNQYNNQKIILSIDRLDYSKGIMERLHAFESLINTYPDLRGNIMLYMVVVPSRDSVSQYKLLHDEINRLVGHINACYGTNEWMPIAYFYNSYSLEELSSLYVAADICLITSIRDGMNLVSKEFIASKSKAPAVLILSELAGASKELIDAIQINPNSIDQIREAIHQAIYMSPEEQQYRLDSCRDIVRKFNTKHWVKLFFNRLREVKVFQKHQTSRRLNNGIKEAIIKRYNLAERRLFFFDYDGTLIKLQNNANLASPTQAVYDILELLKKDEKNEIVIISGRYHDKLTQWFGAYDYYLVAEHGAWTNFPDYKGRYVTELSSIWKYPVHHIMIKYANYTPGAFIEQKSYGLAWHYRKAQPGLGSLRAKELVESLKYLIPKHGLQLLMGNKVIEVKNGELNKGSTARKIITEYNPDFVIAIGDDITDEDMFTELSQEAITIKVGNNQSAARYYVDNQIDAVSFIEEIAKNKLNKDLETVK